MIALATEHGFTCWLAYGTSLRGWALIRQRLNEEGIEQMQAGFAAMTATWLRLGWPDWLTRFAKTYMEAGLIDDGLRAVAEALAITNEHGDRVDRLRRIESRASCC